MKPARLSQVADWDKLNAARREHILEELQRQKEEVVEKERRKRERAAKRAARKLAASKAETPTSQKESTSTTRPGANGR